MKGVFSICPMSFDGHLAANKSEVTDYLLTRSIFVSTKVQDIMLLDKPQFSETLQERLRAFLESELLEAKRQQADYEGEKTRLDLALANVRTYLTDCETQIAALNSTANLQTVTLSPKKAEKVSAPVDAKTYDPNWIIADKILYILRNPTQYGAPTIKGSKGIVDAIITEQPELASNQSLGATVSSKLSRLIQAGSVVRLPAKGRPSENHFIIAEWLDENKNIKSEHQEAVVGLTLVFPNNALNDAQKNSAAVDAAAEPELSFLNIVP